MSKPDLVVSQQIGVTRTLNDGNLVPVAFRGTPQIIVGVPPATPVGATQPTGIPASNIPSPQ